MTHYIRESADSNASAAFDALLTACGHIVTARAKPKKRRTPFNSFDAEPKGNACERATHRAALYRVTGMRV